MSIRYLSLGAMAALAATPALATAVAQAAAPATAAKPAQASAQPTRAVMLRNLDATYKAVDTNGDGSLSSAELAAAESKVQQQRLASMRTRVEAQFTKLDTNRDGVLSKTEFMAAAPQPSAAAPNGAALLAQLDKNKDGRVSVDEYRAPILARFDAVDANRDGVITDAERQAAAKKK